MLAENYYVLILLDLRPITYDQREWHYDAMRCYRCYGIFWVNKKWPPMLGPTFGFTKMTSYSLLSIFTPRFYDVYHWTLSHTRPQQSAVLVISISSIFYIPLIRSNYPYCETHICGWSYDTAVRPYLYLANTSTPGT